MAEPARRAIGDAVTRDDVLPPRWARLLLGVLAGVVIALGMAPYDLWYLSLAGIVAAFVLFTMSPGPLRAVGTGWAVGFGYFGFALGWIVEPFQVDAAATGWMAPFGLIGLAGGLALFWALAFWGAAYAPRARLCALVLAWSAAELARTYVFTGFPWALLAYLWLPTPAIQWSAVVGPLGLSIATLAFCGLVAGSLRKGKAKPALAALAVFAGLMAGGYSLTPLEQSLADRPIVRLVQPNAAQHEKWDPAKVPIFFNRQVAFTEAPAQQGKANPSLIVWPETSLPGLLHRANDALAIISDAAGPASVVIGVQRGDAGRYYNSMAVLDGQGRLSHVYDKHHLVPFGEYMPASGFFKRLNIAGLAARAEGGYTPGPGPTLLDLGELGHALPLICYEAVFPQDVYRAPGRADFLLQITNDAWFGNWSGPYQHLAQARIRAIEQGLPMLRSANTGVSAVIDGAGRVLASLPLGQAGYLDAELPPPMRVTVYSRYGDFPALVLLCIASLVLIRIAGRKSD